MKLALFDLDNTLLDGDSDYLWGEFLVRVGAVDANHYREENARYYREYLEGRLDIHEFLNFGLRPLTDHSLDTLRAWHREFMTTDIRPRIPDEARALVACHRDAGHTNVIITATNRFVTEPVAREFDVDALIATDPEFVDGRYTGRVAGTPSFREGKVERLDAWLAERGDAVEESWFYSDSRNDLPLLERVDHPVAVNPDDTLARVADERGWPVRTLKSGAPPMERPVGDSGAR